MVFMFWFVFYVEYAKIVIIWKQKKFFDANFSISEKGQYSYQKECSLLMLYYHKNLDTLLFKIVFCDIIGYNLKVYIRYFLLVSAERNGIFCIFAIVILKPNIMNDIQLILRGIDGGCGKCFHVKWLSMVNYGMGIM